MQRLVANKITNFLRVCIPVGLSVVLILFAVLPYGMPKSALAAPILALISVYYWSVFRPDLMPTSAAFLLGLLVDILSAGPPGLNALVFILVHWAASSQRRALAGKSFSVGWLGYFLIAAAAAVVTWAVACLFHTAILDYIPLLVSHAVGTAAYPLVAVLLSRVQTYTLPT